MYTHLLVRFLFCRIVTRARAHTRTHTHTQRPECQTLPFTFSVDEPLAWGCVRGGQLLLDFGDVLGVKVIEQTLAYQIVLQWTTHGEEELIQERDGFSLCRLFDLLLGY